MDIHGKLLESGFANFNFDKDETKNFYVKLDCSGKEKIVWGIDLSEKVSQFQSGDHIEIKHAGKSLVKVPDKNGDMIETNRNTFNVSEYVQPAKEVSASNSANTNGTSAENTKVDAVENPQLTIPSSKNETGFSDDEIPKEIFGVKLSVEDRAALAAGKSTSLLENMDMDDGTVKDGRASLSRNKKTGEVELGFNFKKTKITIPEQIEDYKLNTAQQEDLMNGKTVLIKHSGQDRYLKIDNELNMITVKSDREIGIPKEIGGYILTDQDKEKLANNEKLTARVYEGKGRYFIASVSITEDNKGITFSDIKEISPNADIKALKEKYNTHNESVTHAAISAAAETVKANEKGKETSAAIVEPVIAPVSATSEIQAQETPEIKNTAAVDVAVSSVNDASIEKGAFIAAIDNKDYALLSELSEKQKPAQSDIDYVVNSSSLDKNDKICMLSAMKADVKELDKPRNVAKEQQSDNIQLKEKGPEKEQKKPGAGKTVEKAAQQAFSDM